MKDTITVWKDDGTREKLTKHYMNVFVRDVFFLEFNVGRSTFFSLRPKNILLLKDSPKDQSKCKTHENLILKLEAMGVIYDQVSERLFSVTVPLTVVVGWGCVMFVRMVENLLLVRQLWTK